jgi:hypothetical protein
MTVVILLACTLPEGCGDARTVWSASSESPDGRWTAVANTREYTGPGANSVETVVEIKELKQNILFRAFGKSVGFLE